MENQTKKDPMINKIVLNNYLITKKLGEGSFGKIYQAESCGLKFAIKFESKSKNQGLLETEANFMSYLEGRKHY